MLYPNCDDYEDGQEQQQIYEFLTPTDVMEELSIGKSTFYRLVNSGALPAFRIGKQWRVKRSDLMNWKL